MFYTDGNKISCVEIFHGKRNGCYASAATRMRNIYFEAVKTSRILSRKPEEAGDSRNAEYV